MCEKWHNKYVRRKWQNNTKMLIKNDYKGWRKNAHCFKGIKYCLGNGLELFSASLSLQYAMIQEFYARDSRLCQ